MNCPVEPEQVESGATQASFAVLDVMRLLSGILSRMGLIGAGAILRWGEFVLGVTTATLWFVTILGLCLGGGQIAWGLIGLALGVVVVSSLEQVGRWKKQNCRARLTVVVAGNGLNRR